MMEDFIMDIHLSLIYLKSTLNLFKFKVKKQTWIVLIPIFAFCTVLQWQKKNLTSFFDDFVLSLVNHVQSLFLKRFYVQRLSRAVLRCWLWYLLKKVNKRFAIGLQKSWRNLWKYGF